MRTSAGFYGFYAIVKYHFWNILFLNDFTRVLSGGRLKCMQIANSFLSLTLYFCFALAAARWYNSLPLPKETKDFPLCLIPPHNRIFVFCFDTWKAFFIAERQNWCFGLYVGSAVWQRGGKLFNVMKFIFKVWLTRELQKGKRRANIG